MNAPIVLLVNPSAGRGRAARVARTVYAAMLEAGLPVQWHESREAGDEARIATVASESGARALAVVGGDGAISHATRGLLRGEAGGGARVPLAIFGAGTGNDFAKSLAVPVHNVPCMVAHVAAGLTHDVDVGFVNDVPFVNAAGFGFDVEVLTRMRTPGLLRGTAAYVSTALRALLGYDGFTARLDSALPSRRLMMVFANGRCFGGAFRIAPTAHLADGLLDCVAIGNVSPFARLPLFARAVRGAHIGSPHVTVSRGETFTVRFDAPPMFETDGEVQQSASRDVVVRVQRAALRIIA
jgi:diacylglycerol kinase (ATP)